MVTVVTKTMQKVEHLPVLYFLHISQASCCVSVTSALGRLRKEDEEFKPGLPRETLSLKAELKQINTHTQKSFLIMSVTLVLVRWHASVEGGGSLEHWNSRPDRAT